MSSNTLAVINMVKLFWGFDLKLNKYSEHPKSGLLWISDSWDASVSQTLLGPNHQNLDATKLSHFNI